jgi:hypothetical protein
MLPEILHSIQDVIPGKCSATRNPLKIKFGCHAVWTLMHINNYEIILNASALRSPRALR